MKSKQAPPSYLVPKALGRSDGDLLRHGSGQQLDLFRETLTNQAMLQIIAMMGLSDTKGKKRLDTSQSAKVADIARAMGYEPKKRADGKTAFPPWIYQAIEETGIRLRRKAFPWYIREPKKDGKIKAGIVELSVLQEFGFYYEDEEGQPIDLDEIRKDQLIKYEAVKGSPLYAIPMTDAKGNRVLNSDGTERRRLANGVWWMFSTRIANLAEDRRTSWVIFLDTLPILRKYLSNPATFKLMIKTLFWAARTPLIEMSHEKLLEHLDINSKDNHRNQRAIDDAFANMLKEGIIDKPVTVRPSGYYKPTSKTGRPRRIDKVYQWKRAAKWNPGESLIPFADEGTGPESGQKTEIMKSGNQDKGL